MTYWCSACAHAEAGAEGRRIQEISVNLDALAGVGALINVVHEGSDGQIE